MDFPPAASPVVGDDRPEHFAERLLVDGLAVAEGNGAGCLVVVSRSDDAVRIRNDAAVV
ncbi:hypothetical protein J7E83_13025 [Arthrobacter sp. ISL-48]|uniref:hypothetical protein n=1 Tax=Arthrobacter sp. ISL-48 TaxID=2819110 RepID=UPI001BE7A335|nr:hypothetical protein [Arthrobacter sp. ISL-48]MBT2533026.1 hypothetical protein [Arthrobacter sp. ISL-48]